MPNRTGISWCDETWNPFVGCSPTSPACVNCYAQDMAARIIKMAAANSKESHYLPTIRQPHGQPRWTGEIARAPEAIRFAPLRRRRRASRARDIFVGSMTDFWHAGVPREWQIEALAIATLTPHDRYLFVTKRAAEMQAFMSDPRAPGSVWLEAAAIAAEHRLSLPPVRNPAIAWPLPNVALGVTVEDQARADERIPELLATPSAKRFVSCEPCLGLIDWKRWLPTKRAAKRPDGTPFLAPHFYMTRCEHCGWVGSSELCGSDFYGDDSDVFCPACSLSICADDMPRLDFVIAGGESGKDARFTHPDHVRSLRDQCAAAGVAFHFKQWGEWLPVEIGADGEANPPIPLNVFQTLRRWDGRSLRGPGEGETVSSFMAPGLFAIRAGKHAAGHLLDGREHRDRLPQRSAA